ncbi:MAG: hypothetical protein P8076_03805 [Gammaproteobacteria bacterium]
MMSDLPALQSALLGIQRGLEGVNKNASQIASAKQMDAENPADEAKPLVEMLENRNQVEASAKVLKTVSDTIGTLIDTKA